MKKIKNFSFGMGIGGWLTNYKRFHVLPQEWRFPITIGDVEHFESYITEADIKNIKEMGMDHVRVGFDQIVLEESPYVYRKLAFDLLHNFVNWCEKYEMRPILNLHKAVGNYCDVPSDVHLLDSDELQDRFVALWLKLEEEFADSPDTAFELLNEVQNAAAEKWDILAERTINEIRKINKDRIIIIGSAEWNSPDKLAEMKLYDDENIIYTFHTYAPFEFTHQQGVLQCCPLYYNRKMPYPCDDIERYRDYHRLVHKTENPYFERESIDINYIRDSLKGAAEFVKNHPDKILWCGEFGTIRHANIKWRENWMRDVITVLKENDIPYSVWNYLSTPNDGNRFSLVDDDSRKILSEGLLKAIRGE